MDQDPHPAPEWSTPPVRPTGRIPAERSNWPTWLGVLLCVFGGLGLIQRFFGTIFMAAMPLLPLPPEAQVGQSLWRFGLVLSIVGLPISAIHLTAGILTLKRRPSARAWIVAFFVYAMLLLPPTAVYQIMTIQQQLQQMQANQHGGATPGAAMAGFVMGVSIGIIIQIVVIAWPVFLVVWFSRSTVREDIRGWRLRADAA